jgi:MFS family permease
VNPASAKKTALFVTIVNLVMTFPAVYLIDKLGRRTLILGSLATMSLSSIVMGYSINNDMYIVASIGILAFVVSFAGGLGPVPFVLLGELPKEEVILSLDRSALSLFSSY